jgi:hypothetical protein
MLTQRQAQEQAARLRKRADPGVAWGGVRLPSESSELFYLICGSTGSGKTKVLSAWLGSVLPTILPGSDRRLLLADPKNRLGSVLFAMAPRVPVAFLNPADLRSCAWDISADVNSVAGALEAATVFVPTNPQEAQPFFPVSVRNALAAVFGDLLLHRGPGGWRLRDAILILEDQHFFRQVVERTPHVRQMRLILDPLVTWQSIQSTAVARMAELRIIAAFWEHARQRLSLERWVNAHGSILVLGDEPTISATVSAFNRLVVKRLSALILAKPDDSGSLTYLALDEFSALGGDQALAGVIELCRQGRGPGARLGIVFQSIEDLRRVYTAAGASVMTGQFGNKILLRTEEPEQAAFCQKVVGTREAWEEEVSTTTGGGRASRSRRWVRVVRPCVLDSEFMSLPPATPRNGISGYALAAHLNGCWRFHLPGPWVSRHVPGPHPYYPGFVPRPPEQQYLEPFTADDLARLGLRPEPGGG